MQTQESIKFGQPGSMEYILRSQLARSAGGLVKLAPGTAKRILEELNFPGQRTGYTKRRKQIWEALHPEEKSIGATCATTPTVSVRGRVGEGRPEGFASATAEATGQSKATTNRAIARADALGDDVERITGTSLDSGVEMDALAKLPTPERAEIIERAVAGEQVSARAPKTEPEKSPALNAIRRMSDNDLLKFLFVVQDKGVGDALKSIGG